MRDTDEPAEGGVGGWSGLPPGFVAGFSTRRLVPDTLSLDEATATLARALGVPSARRARARQVHGRVVRALDAGNGDEPEVVGEGDALVTAEPGVLLVVQTADCVPIVLMDPETGTIAAVHAGWRGTALRVLDAALDVLESRGVRLGSLTAAFGPAICRDRYEVGPEVMAALTAAYPGVTIESDAWRAGEGDRARLDVAAYNRAALRHRGVRTILGTSLCTASRADLFPSYRRDGQRAGRIVTGVLRTG